MKARSKLLVVCVLVLVLKRVLFTESVGLSTDTETIWLLQYILVFIGVCHIIKICQVDLNSSMWHFRAIDLYPFRYTFSLLKPTTNNHAQTMEPSSQLPQYMVKPYHSHKSVSHSNVYKLQNCYKDTVGVHANCHQNTYSDLACPPAT